MPTRSSIRQWPDTPEHWMLKGGGGPFPDEHEIGLGFVQLCRIGRRGVLDEIDNRFSSCRIRARANHSLDLNYHRFIVSQFDLSAGFAAQEVNPHATIIKR